MKPVARFRVYAWRSSLYFIVQVWATKKELLENRVTLGLARTKDTDAHVTSYDVVAFKSGRARKRPIVGEINFHRKKLGAGVISHECFHATMGLLRRLNFDFTSLGRESVNLTDTKQEELAAVVHGEFVRKITCRFYDLGIYK